MGLYTPPHELGIPWGPDDARTRLFRLRRWPRISRRTGANLRLITGSERVTWWLIAVAWTCLAVDFWAWWLLRVRPGTPALFWPYTVAMLYQTTVLPTLFFHYVYRMRQPVAVTPAPGLRVAMVTLCVPDHESLAVIREQLEALTQVTYEHDSWVLDEGASAAVEKLAGELGVRYFTRKGIPRWNQPVPPFQKATKAGNVNAWLDHVAELGLEYDVFVQLDIDHRPSPAYLERVLGYFRDPAVGWVQAPSVCGNLDDWPARGLAEQDMIFQGPLQMGFYGATGTPFIVGSHTAYRTAAIREIGGFQPTRAEDHLDTVVLAAHGFKGVFVPEVIAVGDGPHTFATYLRQQFAWAYSMIHIFLRYTPWLLGRYTVRQALQFLMCQSWYALWSLSFAVLWAVPTAALVLGEPIAQVSLSRFAVYFLPVPLMATVMWLWSRRWFQPIDLRLSWRGPLLEIARWPVVLWALVNVVLRVRRPYMITPKGVARVDGPRLASIYVPYLALPLVPLAAVLGYASSGAEPLHGYYALALFNAVWGVVLLVSTLLIELRGIPGFARGDRRSRVARMAILATVAFLVGVLAAGVLVSWQPTLQALR